MLEVFLNTRASGGQALDGSGNADSIMTHK